MAKKSKNDRPAVPAVSPDRARRLIQLVQMLGGGSLARSKLMRPLRLDVRGFYRDLQCLRSAGIEVALENGKYTLLGKQEDALSRVPFPDPGLCFGEAVTLSKGQSAPHQRLKQMVSGLLGATRQSRALEFKAKNHGKITGEEVRLGHRVIFSPIAVLIPVYTPRPVTVHFH